MRAVAMTASLFARTLSSAAMVEVFADRALVAAMLAFEAALAEAEAAEGADPGERGRADRRRPAHAERFDVDALVAEARPRRHVRDPAGQAADRARRRERRRRRGIRPSGSTSQDVIDTRDGAGDAPRARPDRRRPRSPDRRRCSRSRARTRDADAGAHADAAGAGDQLRLQGGRLARAAGARARPPRARRRGGAAAAARRRGRHARRARRRGPAVARSASARASASRRAEAAWHVQRDAWVALGCEVALLCGSLGKIGRDLALLAQGEVGEVAEPAARRPRRLVGDAATSAIRSPRWSRSRRRARAAARGGAARGDAAAARARPRQLAGRAGRMAGAVPRRARRAAALADACAGLEVDAARMRDNIERQHGTVFAEAAAALLAPALGKAAAAHALLGRLAAATPAAAATCQALARRGRRDDPALARRRPRTHSPRPSTSTPRAPRRRARRGAARRASRRDRHASPLEIRR